MEFKNCKEMTNAELRLYQKALEDEDEVIKAEISDRFKKLDEMDVEYQKVENELNNRRNIKR